MKTLLLITSLFALSISLFAQQSESTETQTKNPIKPNTIAVLPVPFVNTQTNATSAELPKFAQSEIHKELISQLSKIYPLTVQDLRTTNSLLRKAGLTTENLDDVEIHELEEILGVDNIVTVKVQYTTTSTQISSAGVNVKTDPKKISGTETGVKTETINYNYKIHFDLYKNGTQIYSKAREPFSKLQDAWVDGVHYLLKRSPIYTK